MENVILIVHLLLALSLIGAVLLQRSEGGGLGMGSGGGGGANAGRAPSTALGKLTWVLAICFIGTSITLTVLAAQNSSGSSVVDRITGINSAPAPDLAGDSPATIDTDGLLPPPSSADADAPLVPRAD